MRWYQTGQLGYVHPLRHHIFLPVDVSLRLRETMLLKHGHASCSYLRLDRTYMVPGNLLLVTINQLYRHSTRTILLAHGTDHVLLLRVCVCDLRHF